MDKILIIDSHNNIYRACVNFGPPPEHDICSNCTDDRHRPYTHCKCKSPWNEEERYCYGDRYGFVCNFFRNLRPIVEDFSPDKIFMVFEGHPQFRYDLYADYKANRIIKTASKQESRDKFIKTMDIIIPLLQYMPITMASAANYEADDTIGSLCENMRDEDITVLSSDSDFTQLLQRGYKQIRIYNPIKKEFVVPPTWHYVTWKCLNGDKSDNIPSLLKPKKAIETASDPEKLRKFMEVEEQRASFQVNRQLIDFANVPEEEIVLTEGIRQFDLLKQHFADMKFESIINDTSWERFTKTFDCVKY